MPLNRALTCVALVCTAPVALLAPTSPATARQARADDRLAGLADFVDGVMAEQIASREVAGAVVTVVANGRVLFTRGYGFANVAKQVPVDGQRTLFRPGSVSKLFTWVALTQQIEQGRVDLDADVNRYLDFRIPDFQGAPIRVRDLMSHSPGMSDVGGFITDSPDKLTPYQQWIKAHVPARLWAPGTEIAYSNYGAALAGYIVERVSGEAYPDYVERHIFAPLGMTSTTFREPLPAALAPRMADGHRLVNGQLVPRSFEYLSAIMPAGSATSSAPDMARFMLAILGNGALAGKRILRPESIALLERDSLTNVAGMPGLAHGFLVEREAGPRMIGHAGNTADFHSDLVLAPAQGIGFFISFTGGQGSYVARTELRNALIGRLFPRAPAPRYTGDAPPPPLGAYRANRRDYSRPANPAHDLKVEMPAPHVITVTAEGMKTAYAQIAPDEYEQVTGARAGGPYDRLKFYGGPRDPRLSLASEPYETYHFVKPE
ncbi:beta-lactamase family protein [Sphingomonas sp. CL5.1]|uniref:serine hydrolase domain-containing protein n=1 Tax=Sphingomonas sp. CL5.1 TaxID=2653203 RepID=UPI0015824594|nr:serine hydrolase domain-containing protein [Sphingomonas sp. CL5.1]QKR99803.1 beta-lactamase family protein [Sphingomonas sp. CL5.1]